MQSYLCSDTSHPYTYRDFPVSLAQDQLHVRENDNRVSFISVLIVFFFFFGGRGGANFGGFWSFGENPEIQASGYKMAAVWKSNVIIHPSSIIVIALISKSDYHRPALSKKDEKKCQSR